MKEEYALQQENIYNAKHEIKNNWLKHWQLVTTCMCGLLIMLAYIFPTFSIPFFISAFVIGGFAKAKEGIEDLIYQRTLNVEILMILAAIGAAVVGHWAEGAILIFIFALSGAMEAYALNKSERDLSKLIRLQPEIATRIEDGEYKRVAIAQLDLGDHILVKPGERFPIDGSILQGSSSIDESPISGEAIPVEKNEGDQVFAGTLNINGSIVMEVTKLSKDTLFQKIVALVQEAQQDKAPSQQFVERFEKTYVKVVLIIVLIMFFLPHYLLSWSWKDTIYRALVLLVVASPCALVASISPAILSVLSYGARNGILIKGGSNIERLSHIQVVAMDKTGTITTGKPMVTDVLVRKDLEETSFIQIVASLEGHSAHPLAESVVKYAEQLGVSLIPLEGITDVPGRGIYGYSDGVKWSIGNASFIGEEDAEQFLNQQKIEDKLAGKTIIFVRDSTGIAGAIALQDEVREEARQAIQNLKEQNIHVVMITGDQSSVAEAIAKEVQVSEYRAETLPDQKMEIILHLRNKYGQVVMVGDGINDAPALAKADVGVAMGGGTDIALNTADLVLVKNNLQKVADAIKTSKKMNRIIKQNIFFSIAVIALLILANYLQVLTLPLGVLGHEGSTILVILNGLRLLRG